MPTTVVLIAGLLVVIGGILLLRMHAFIALVLAALLVAAMTSPDAVVRSQLLTKSIRVVVSSPAKDLDWAAPAAEPVDPAADAVDSAADATGDSSLVIRTDTPLNEELLWAIVPSTSAAMESASSITFRVRKLQSQQDQQVYALQTVDPQTGTSSLGTAQQQAASPASQRSTETDTRSNSAADLSARVPVLFNQQLAGGNAMRLVSKADLDVAMKQASRSPIARVTEAIGTAAGKLAILIVAAAVIGYCLLHSGAADQVVRSFLNAVGEKASPVAFAFSGFVLAIPVFFDTVFLLMIPLAKSLYQRTRRNYLLSVLAIVVGGTMAHSLVPPTPGPLLIAEQFGVSITAMIFGGTIVGLFASGCGLLFAFWANGRHQLIPPEFRDDAGSAPTTSAPTTSAPVEDGAGVESNTTVGESALIDNRHPSLPEALLPVGLPVLLMALGTCFDQSTGTWQPGPFALPTSLSLIMQAVCERNMALIIGAALATWTLIRFRRPTREQLAAGMQNAVTSAGTIILVTAAGGAFGKMMEQTSVAELLQQIPAASPVAIVVAAFFVTTAVRTAQGSATVAMMTAAGVFGGLVTSGAAGVAPLYVALAVGCGSKPFAWMNDSGFLVITRMSGMNESQGLRCVTAVMAIAGFAGLLAVIVGVVFFPNLPS